MGYYSEVVLALTGNGVNELHTQLESPTLDNHIRNEVKDLLDCADMHFIDQDSKAEVWHWNSIKWYTDDPEYYADIYFIEEFLKNLDDKDYRFIRMGEDYEDTEVMGYFTNNPFDIEIRRMIIIKNNGPKNINDITD